MICPVCYIELNNYNASGIELDICAKCEGVWFDKGEFQHFVNSLVSTGAIQDQPIKKALRKKAFPIIESQRRNLHCPRCNNQLELKNFSFDSNVFVDKCFSCHGLWTDKGELLEIAKYVKGNEDLQSYAIAIAELYKSKDVWYIKFIKDWHYHIAGLVGIFYIIIWYTIGGSETAWELTLKFLPTPLILIWFGDSLGKFIGMIGLRPPITKTSPGFIVKIAGWIFLLLPVWWPPLSILFGIS